MCYYIHLYKTSAKRYLPDLSPALLESSSVTILAHILFSSVPCHVLIHVMNGPCATW